MFSHFHWWIYMFESKIRNQISCKCLSLRRDFKHWLIFFSFRCSCWASGFFWQHCIGFAVGVWTIFVYCYVSLRIIEILVMFYRRSLALLVVNCDSMWFVVVDAVEFTTSGRIAKGKWLRFKVWSVRTLGLWKRQNYLCLKTRVFRILLCCNLS